MSFPASPARVQRGLVQTPSLGQAIAPGSVVAERYELTGVLGRGGMADVYDAVDLRLARPVAVKVLRPELVARDDVRTRFEAEARAAAGLSHPNAVAVFDTGDHEGAPYLVMERLPGDTLADRIADGPVDEEWVCTAACGVLGALAQAHRAGIVHRDVKPGNILLAADGTAKIADFGIAKSINPSDSTSGHDQLNLTATGQLLGTPAYLAPERIEGHAATPTSDLWALGVVLYEALAGVKPFAGRGALDVAQAIVTGSHVPLSERRPDLDPRLVHTIERAMARQPHDRFVSADQMSDALRGAPVEPTIDERPADGTMVLPTVERPSPEPAPATGTAKAESRPVGAAPRGARRPVRPARPIKVAPFSTWPRLAWLGLIAAILILFLIARAGESERAGVDTVGANGSAATQATTAAQGLATQLRDLASRLDIPNDGARADELAAALRNLAGDVESGASGQGTKATGLIITVAAWSQTGQLGSVATAQALDLLRQVPGVDASAVPAGSQSGSVSSSGGAVSPQPATGNGNNGNNGNGKAKGKND